MTYEKRRSKKKAQMNLDHCRRRSANAFKTQYRRYRRAEKKSSLRRKNLWNYARWHGFPHPLPAMRFPDASFPSKTGEKCRAHNISERKNFSGLKFRRTVWKNRNLFLSADRTRNLLIKILISRFLFLFFNISKKTAHLCRKNRHRFLYRRTPVFRRNHGRNRERSSPTVWQYHRRPLKKQL